MQVHNLVSRVLCQKFVYNSVYQLLTDGLQDLNGFGKSLLGTVRWIWCVVDAFVQIILI